MKVSEFRDGMLVDFNKTNAVLRSCLTQSQSDAARNMVNNFFSKWLAKAEELFFLFQNKEISRLWVFYNMLINTSEVTKYRISGTLFE